MTSTTRRARPFGPSSTPARISSRPCFPTVRRPISEPRAPSSNELPVQKKASKFVDAPVQNVESSGDRAAKPWEAIFPRPPKADLAPLVYQVWNKIKRELAIDRERRAGGF